MLGTAIVNMHVTPAEFWEMTNYEFWAAMKVLNPKLVFNVKQKFYDDDELEILNMMKQKYDD